MNFFVDIASITSSKLSKQAFDNQLILFCDFFKLGILG